MTPIELLAPAKDLECGVAAIDCGADAVYIGASAFGARSAAGNALDDIAELVRYAHKYWAKIYVTVNTLLRDDEVPQALSLISRLYDIAVDGLIIQDVGLLECDLPPLPLIASTQMHNNTPEKVAFLEQVGIRRAILARELDIDRIRAIRRSTGMELECFVHGALCVCYSGQCYLSYALGGRSGNRGQCAQPCRKMYNLFDSAGNTVVSNKHLLSLKDLNLSEHLRELIDAGVCSFKIEGRLKDREYVSNVVSVYRKNLDIVLVDMGLKKSSSGSCSVDFAPDLDKTFNRGYTTYFLNGRTELVGSIDTPKTIGELAGRVVSLGSHMMLLDSRLQLHPGDGICFFNRNGELAGTSINSANGPSVTPDKMNGIEKGTLIYRNHDHQYLTRLSKASAERRIAVHLILRETGDGLELTGRDEDGNCASFLLPCERVRADKPEQALENIRKQLTKSGGTEFMPVSVDVDLAAVCFLPIGLLNALRRGVLENLSGIRLDNRPSRRGGAVQNDAAYPERVLSYLGNVLNSRAEAFYQRRGVTSIEPAAESGLDMRGRKVMTTRYCLKHQLGLCPQQGKSSRIPEPLFLEDAEGHKLEVRFDCARCEMELYLIDR